MMHSMTAFARTEQEYDWGTAIWEIRTVNHRYLENFFRLPEGVRSVEAKLRELTKQTLSRGKLDAQLTLQWSNGAGESQINTQKLAELQLLIKQSGATAPINALELLKWPGLIVEQKKDFDAAVIDIAYTYEKALEQLIENRSREGMAIRTFLLQQLSAIEVQVEHIEVLMPQLIAQQKLKLTKRIEDVLGSDSERVEQEIALLSQKADVQEEIDRLKTHVEEVRFNLSTDKPIGRRLDFLMQELNREANTFSSKSLSAESTKIAVELKVLIEQMREQVQNVE